MNDDLSAPISAPIEVQTSALEHSADFRQNPALVYLSTLGPRSRQTMLAHLRNVARALGCELEQIEWSALRFAEVSALISGEAERINYRNAEQGRLSPATLNGLRACLRGVARCAWLLDQISADDYQRICAVKPVRGSRLPAGRMLTDQEQQALFEACARDPSAAGRRDAAIIALCFGAGLRRAEVVSAKLSEYDGRDGALRVTGKGNKQRLVYLDSGGQAALDEWLSVRGSMAGPLVCPVRKGGKVVLQAMTDQVVFNVLRKRALEAGIANLSPHDGRRTYISSLLEAGADLSSVQKLSGHASVSTTAAYDRRGERAKRKAAAMRRLPFKRGKNE